MNDRDDVLRESVVVQFMAARSQEWKGVERRYKGFKGGVWAPLVELLTVSFIYLLCVPQGGTAVRVL